MRSPILLVAHSLGGFIVKRVCISSCWSYRTFTDSCGLQAICLAKQNPKTYRNVIRRIAGFVFMGCPHSSSQDLKDWVGVEWILQKFTKGRNNSLEPQCVQSLAVDCESFRVILAEDEKHVLTVSEKKGMSKQVIGKKVLVSLQLGYHSSPG